MPRERRATYMDLLCIQWDKFRVPHDLNAVARALGLKPAVFIKEWNETYVHHFTETVDGFVHPRLLKQSEHYQLKAAKAARSSHARWNANASETHMPTHCEGNAIIADADAVEEVVKDKSITPTASKRAPMITDIPDWLPLESWREWYEHRRSTKRAMTESGQRKTLKLLAQFRADGHNPVSIIDRSIANGWQGLFPPEGAKSQSKPKSSSHDLLAGYTPEQLRGE